MKALQKALTLTAFLLLACLSALSAINSRVPAPERKNASACTLREETIPTPDGCTFGSESCYVCDYTNQYGTYRCYEAPDPADATYCSPIDYQNYGSLRLRGAVLRGDVAANPGGAELCS